MKQFQRWLFSLCFLFLSLPALAITNAELFTWAAATYPDFFPGTPIAGQYQQYDYRSYPSGNYLAVDDAGSVCVLGPVSGGQMLCVDTLARLASTIAAWEATQPASVLRGKVLVQAWKEDGTQATIQDFVDFTHYVINRWQMYQNYGVFPLGKAPSTAQIASDISIANVDGIDYIGMDAPVNQPFYFTALWKAPVIGTVFMRADAAGAGYMITGAQPQKIQLPYDFAVSEFKLAQSLASGVALSSEAQSLLSQATSAMNTANTASTPSARAVAAYTALSYVMPLKERLVLDASNASIAASPVRTDFDMNYEGFFSWTDVANKPGYDAAKAAGFKSVLSFVDWRNVSPTQGTYDFSTLDYQVDQAIAQGFKVALSINTVGNDPAWMQALTFEQQKALKYENARRVVAHFGSKVSWYYPASEFELNLAGKTMAQAAELARQSLAGARAASPSTLFGVYTSASAYVAYQMNPSAGVDYLSGADLLAYMKANGINFDFVGLEMQYGTTFAPVDLQRFQEILQDTYKVAQVPIYLGETGSSSMTQDYGIAGAFHWHDGLTQQSQYEWADGTLRILYAMPFVKGYYWVHLDPDNNDYGSDYLSGLVGTGLVTASGAVKKVYSAFHDFAVELASRAAGH